MRRSGIAGILFLIIIALLLFPPGCSEPSPNEWTGTAISTRDTINAGGEKQTITSEFENVCLQILGDTFILEGLDLPFKGLLFESDDPHEADLIDFNSYEYDIYDNAEEMVENGSMNIVVSGRNNISDEYFLVRNDSLTLHFRKNTFEEDERLYQINMVRAACQTPQ